MKNNIIFLLLICIIGCSKKETYQIANIPIETIDIESLNEESETLPNRSIKNRSYINISAENKELLFAYINQIKITNNQIYILDSWQKVFVVFDINGKGISKIGDIGRAPEEYLNATSFSIDTIGNIYIVDGRQDKINVYDKNFKFIYSQKLPFDADIFHCLPSGGFMFGLSSWNNMNNAKDKIIITNSDLSTQKVFCQYDEYIDNDIWFSDYYFMETSNSIFYNRPLDNIVYEFSKQGEPIKGYYFNFGKKEIPPYIKKNREKYKDLYKDTRGLLFFTIITPNYIFGQMLDDNKPKVFLIDKLKKSIYIEDKSAFSKLGNIIGYDRNKIITYISPGEYTKMLNEKKNIDLPVDVQQHLQNEGFTLCLYELLN